VLEDLNLSNEGFFFMVEVYFA